jgi:AraC family transcriptional regulator
MSNARENPLAFRALYDGPLVRVEDYSCRFTRGGPGGEECSDLSQVVLVRRGAFCRHFGRRSVLADANQAVFFSGGAAYRVSHPADCGDRGTVLTPAPEALSDILREFDHDGDICAEHPFPFLTGPCDAGLFWRHHELVRRLPHSAEPLWAEETALRLVADLVSAAFAQCDLPRRPRRQETVAAHAERVEAAKSYLAGRVGERTTLGEAARAAGASPFHLARAFRQQTGVPVHRYLVRLRLRTSLERLAEGAHDLAALALELGFDSHSHFAAAFRREFDRTPSEVRRAGRRALRELSKNLKV